MAFTLPWKFPNMANPGHPCSKASGDCCQYVGQVILIILGTVVALQITINTVCMAIPRLRRLIGYCCNFRFRKRSSKRVLKGLENPSQMSHIYLPKSADGKEVDDREGMLKAQSSGKSLELECDEGCALGVGDCAPYPVGGEKHMRQRSYPRCPRYRRPADSSESRSSLGCGHGGELEARSRPGSPDRWSRPPHGGPSPAAGGCLLRPSCYRVVPLPPGSPSPKSSSGGASRCQQEDTDARCSGSCCASHTPDSLPGSEGPPRRCLTPDPYRSSASLARTRTGSPDTYPGGGGGGGGAPGGSGSPPCRPSDLSHDSCTSCASHHRLQTGDFQRPPPPGSPASCLSRASRRSEAAAKSPEPRGRPADRYPPPPPPAAGRRRAWPPPPPCSAASSSSAAIILIPSASPRAQLRASCASQRVNERQRTGRVVYDARVRRAKHARGDAGGSRRGSSEEADSAAWGRPHFYKPQRGGERTARGTNPPFYSYCE